MTVPMRIRIKWQHGQWWAYFNGWTKSYFHSNRLDWMCSAIAKTFPKGTLAAADYDVPGADKVRRELNASR